MQWELYSVVHVLQLLQHFASQIRAPCTQTKATHSMLCRNFPSLGNSNLDFFFWCGWGGGLNADFLNKEVRHSVTILLKGFFFFLDFVTGRNWSNRLIWGSLAHPPHDFDYPNTLALPITVMETQSTDQLNIFQTTGMFDGNTNRSQKWYCSVRETTQGYEEFGLVVIQSLCKVSLELLSHFSIYSSVIMFGGYLKLCQYWL